LNLTPHPVFYALLSVAILALGTAGYVIIEGWPVLDSLYMTVITLATVGYGEIREISQPGRIFTILLIFLGVGFYLYVVGNLIQFLVEGRIREILGRRKLDKQINSLKKHYLVCGYGRIGRVLSRYLIQKYLNVVVIERNENRIPTLNEDGVLYVIGEATDEKTLIKAGIRQAKGLLTVLATDADNVFLVLTARHLNPDLHIVARAVLNATKRTLYAAGADKVISPYDLGARRMAHAILRPTVIHYLELAFSDDDTDIHIEEYPLSERSRLVGVALQDSGIRSELDLIVISIKRSDGTMLFNPSATNHFRVGDTVIAVGKSKNMLKLARLLNPPD
jgi:voltage-gated potassium channel